MATTQHSIHSEMCISGYNVEIEQIALLFANWANFATVKNTDWQQMHTQAYQLLSPCTSAHWVITCNLGHGNHNHNTIDHTQPIKITNE